MRREGCQMARHSLRHSLHLLLERHHFGRSAWHGFAQRLFMSLGWVRVAERKLISYLVLLAPARQPHSPP